MISSTDKKSSSIEENLVKKEEMGFQDFSEDEVSDSGERKADRHSELS